MTEHWKFLHIGELDLGRVPDDIWLPSQKAETKLLEAPYTVLERLADVAIDRQADGVLFSGDLLDPRSCGAYALGKLDMLFRRLAESQIPVFWSLGRLDRYAHWPAIPPWPDNVTQFCEGQWERRTLRKQGREIDIVGRGRHDSNSPQVARSWPAASHEQTPLVVLATVSPDELPPAACGSYWALGGSTTPHEIQRDRPVIHYAGSPQPRAIFHSARGSATWVEISPGGDVQSVPIPVAATVGLRRRFRSADAATCGDFDRLQSALTRDYHRLREELTTADTSVDLWLVEYLLEEVPPLLAWRLRDPTIRHRLLAQLPTAADGPFVAAARLTVASSADPAQLPPDGTLLADFLELLDDPGRLDEATFVSPKNAPWVAAIERPKSDTITSLSREWVMATIAETN